MAASDLSQTNNLPVRLGRPGVVLPPFHDFHGWGTE